MDWVKRFLWTLSGDDTEIIPYCSKWRQFTFCGIGFFVLLIFVLCFVSCYISYTYLFQSFLLGIPIGIFVAFTLTNLYLLTLYTLAKNVLPHSMGRTAKWISLIVRIVFVCFIAIMVSKPFEVVIYSDSLQSEIEHFKKDQMHQFQVSNSEYFAGQRIAIQKMVTNLEQYETAASRSRLAWYRNRLEEIETERETYELTMRNRVESSNYYVRSIAILSSRYPSSWFISLACIAVFTLPLYIKRVIPLSAKYYEEKKSIEMNLIQRAYADFLQVYSDILEQRTGTGVDYPTKFADAPFDTTLKVDLRVWKPEKALIDRLYNEEHEED